MNPVKIIYPASYFVFIEIPQPAERVLNAALKMAKASKQSTRVAA
jgi:hypothetical protein